MRSGQRVTAALLVVLAIVGFVTSWMVIHHGIFARSVLVDTAEYQHYGELIRAGGVPYRDFTVEYPPAALPVFLIPALLTRAGDLASYNGAFGLIMEGCGLLAVALALGTLIRRGDSTARVLAGTVFAATLPVLLGSVVLTRYDLWPAVLCTGAVVAVVWGWRKLGFGLLAIAVAAKGYPIVILPLCATEAWRVRGRREALLCLGAFAASLAACVGPFLVLAPGSVWSSIAGQASRPLQIESLGASVLLAAHQLFGTHLTLVVSHGSQNLGGHAAGTLASLESAMQAAAILAIWLLFARGPATAQRLLIASAAAVCAFVVFDRVLSPQYLIWLAPLVLMLPGVSGLRATVLVGAAMILTQMWYPIDYWRLTEFAAAPSWLVLVRDAVLLALLATLTRSITPRTGLHAYLPSALTRPRATVSP